MCEEKNKVAAGTLYFFTKLLQTLAIATNTDTDTELQNQKHTKQQQ